MGPFVDGVATPRGLVPTLRILRWQRGTLRLRVAFLRIPSRIAFVLAAIMFGTYAIAYQREERSQRAVVVTKEVIARKGDAESYAPAFTQPLREGQELGVFELRNGFVRVALESGIDGWVPASSLVIY